MNWHKQTLNVFSVIFSLEFEESSVEREYIIIQMVVVNSIEKWMDKLSKNKNEGPL